MTLLLYVVLNFSIVATEYIMLYLICDGLFKKKRNNKQQFWGLCGLILVSYAVILYKAFMQNEVFMRISILVFCSIWCISFFKTTWLKALLVSVFFQGLMVILDLTVLAGVSGLFFNNIVPSNQIQMYLGIFAKMFELVLIVFLWKWLRKRFHRTEDTWVNWLRIGFIPISTFGIALIIARVFLAVPDLAEELLFCSLVTLFLDVSSIFLLDTLEEQQLLTRDHALLQQSLKREQESLAAWESAYKAQRKQTHDIQNHLLILQGMAEEQESYSSLSAYLSKILVQWKQTEARVSTRRNVVDILLNQKFAVATSKDIRFELQLADLSEFPLPDDELIVVLANLIDNAISACCAITEKSQRLIRLKMDVSGGSGHLHIENTTAEPVQVVDNQVIKSFDKNGLHGYGLQNIRSVFDKHDAIYVIDYLSEKSMFVVSAQIDDERDT